MKTKTIGRGKWSYYESNTRLTNAGVYVIGIKKIGQTKRKTFYRVRTLCCGVQLDMSHRAIDQRVSCSEAAIADGIPWVSVCVRCVGRVNGTAPKRKFKGRSLTDFKEPGAPYNVVQPTWPKPPSIPVGYWLWCDRGVELG